MSEKGCSFDKTLLVSYLYEECDAGERGEIETHLAACPLCRAELASLRGVQTQLETWAPPDEILDFRVVRRPERASRWWWPLPVWAQAVAAVLVLMAGAAAAKLEVRVGSDGVVVRSGWSEAAPVQASARPLPAGTAVPVAVGTGSPWRADLAALEQRLRLEFAPRVESAGDGPRLLTAADERRLLAEVREIVRESEDRQRSEIGVRLAGTFNEFDTRRRADLVRLQESFGQLEGRTGIEVARTNSMLQYLMRVSQASGTVIK